MALTEDFASNGPSDGYGRLDRGLSPEDKRELILRAAARLFIEKGFENATLDDLAARLSVTKPTIYYYVRSKDDLLLTIMRRGGEAMNEAFRRVLAEHSDVTSRLRAFARVYLEVVFDDFGRCIASLPDRALSETSRAEVREGKGEIDRNLRALIAAGIAEGAFRPIDPRHAAAAFFGMLNWTTTWRTEKSAPLAVIAADMADIFLAGLQTHSETT